MRALSKGQRAIVRKDVKKMASDPALRADLRAIRFCEPESSEAEYVARRVVELCKWNRWEIPLEALSI